MYPCEWTHNIRESRVVVVTLAALLTIVAPTANAQQSSLRHDKLQRVTDDGPRTSRNPTTKRMQRSTSSIDASSVQYEVVPLGVLPSYTNTAITDDVNVINNLGHVAGFSFLAEDSYSTARPFLWKSGKRQPLPLPRGASGGFATGVNDRDQVIAETNEFDSNGMPVRRAFMVDHGKVIGLPALDADSNTQPFAINYWGSAVGINHNRTTGNTNPVAWSGGKIYALPLLQGNDEGIAFGINDFGIISGYQFPADDSSETACLWYWNGNGYSVLPLKSLGGDYSELYGINNWGQTVGFSTDADNLHAPAALWDLSGPHVLPLLPGDTDGQGNGINDRGKITGYDFGVDENGNDITRIVLWQNGKVTDLQTEVPAGTPDLTQIGNVNLWGQIAVNIGYLDDGSLAAAVLIPKRR
jgi:uncharacterized membrane protein